MVQKGANGGDGLSGGARGGGKGGAAGGSPGGREGGAEGGGAEGGAFSPAPWDALLGAIDPLVRPVLAASGLFGGGDEVCVDAVGCVLSLPGAPGQMWHPDCVSRVGLVNAFIPLTPLTDSNGPTALALGTHRPPRPDCPRVVRPLLLAGEVLLFDWRTWHRGCANYSPADRPVAYVTYARRGVAGVSYKDNLPSLKAHLRTLAATDAGEEVGLGWS